MTDPADPADPADPDVPTDALEGSAAVLEDLDASDHSDEPDELDEPDEFEESDFADGDIEPSGQLQKWRRSTASGSILGAVALGLREVFENPREEAPIVMEAAGEPPGPRRIELDLDPDDPGASTVTYRPWMDGDEPT